MQQRYQLKGFPDTLPCVPEPTAHDLTVFFMTLDIYAKCFDVVTRDRTRPACACANDLLLALIHWLHNRPPKQQ